MIQFSPERCNNTNRHENYSFSRRKAKVLGLGRVGQKQIVQDSFKLQQ